MQMGKNEMTEHANKILEIIKKSSQTITSCNSLTDTIEYAIESIVNSIKSGKKLVIFGNGGSAADAQHLAAEFISRYQLEGKSIPAIALTTDTSILTAIGNDYGFEKIFERQCESLINDGDVIIAISTSGNSKNVLLGVKKCKEKGAKVIGLGGRNGGSLKELTDIMISIPSDETPRIQEGHRVVIHVICEIVEKYLRKWYYNFLKIAFNQSPQLNVIREYLPKLARVRIASNLSVQQAALESLRGPQEYISEFVSELKKL